MGFLQREVMRQAMMLAYIDNFLVIGLCSFAMIPLVLMLKKIPLGKGGGGH
jgi:hypothetical protein